MTSYYPPSVLILGSASHTCHDKPTVRTSMCHLTPSPTHSHPVQCTPARQETPGPGKQSPTISGAVTSNQKALTTFLPPAKLQGTNHHRNYPSSPGARFNSLQRNNSPMSIEQHHLSLEPLEVWICDIFVKRLIFHCLHYIFAFIVYHI